MWSLLVVHCDFVYFSNMALSLWVYVPMRIMRAIPTPPFLVNTKRTQTHLLLLVCMNMWFHNVCACMCCYFELSCCRECSQFSVSSPPFVLFVCLSIEKLQLTIEAENPSIWIWLVRRFVWFHDSSYDLFTWTRLVCFFSSVPLFFWLPSLFSQSFAFVCAFQPLFMMRLHL